MVLFIISRLKSETSISEPLLCACAFMLSPFLVGSVINIQSTDSTGGRLPLCVGWENDPERGLKAVLFTPRQLPVIKANSADSVQTLSFVASDLGLHCLLMSLYKAKPQVLQITHVIQHSDVTATRIAQLSVFVTRTAFRSTKS